MPTSANDAGTLQSLQIAPMASTNSRAFWLTDSPSVLGSTMGASSA